MPVAARARQAAHLDAQHHAHMIQTHLGQQFLESLASLGRGPAVSLVLIDHPHPIGGPSPVDGPLLQGILQGC